MTTAESGIDSSDLQPILGLRRPGTRYAGRKGYEMRRLRFRSVMVCGTACFLALGCCVYTSFQTAQTLSPGSVTAGLQFGGGGYFGNPGGVKPSLDLGPTVRVGIVRDLDVGLRPASLCGDIKYQFLHGPLAGALDLEVSRFPRTNIYFFGDGTDYVENIGFYPTVLFSGNHYFCGLRVICLRQIEEGQLSTPVLPGVVAGLSVGRRFRFVPEVCCYYNPGSRGKAGAAVGGGFAFQYTFGKQ
jgi:hypothetical protein